MTAVEAIVVIALFSILSLAIFSSVQYLYQTDGYSNAQAGEVDSARRGMTQLSRDLREMAYAEDGTFPIAVKDTHLIGFYSDYDKDDAVEYVEYELVGTTLFKRTYNPTGNPPTYDLSDVDTEETLSIYVRNVEQATTTFSYYDANNSLLDASALLTDVRYIRTQLIVNIDPIRSPGEFMLRSSVAPRNLKDNL
jgi:type II secretory pathway component PulJ